MTQVCGNKKDEHPNTASMHNWIKELTEQKVNQATGSIKSKEGSLIIVKNTLKIERIHLKTFSLCERGTENTLINLALPYFLSLK